MNYLVSNKYKSQNFDNRTKNTKIKYIIIHYTETKNLTEAIKLLSSSKRKVSCHYIIDTKGKIYNLVQENKRAWHAGISSWSGDLNLNNRSIGVELVNKGELSKNNYKVKQIDSLIKLIIDLKQKYFIKDWDILGHSDIAPERKIDPGIFFPWEKLSNYSIGLWYNLDKESLKESLDKGLEKIQLIDLYSCLKQIGYSKINLKKKNGLNLLIINSFHRHYIPKLLGKKPTVESLIVARNLLKIKKNHIDFSFK